MTDTKDLVKEAEKEAERQITEAMNSETKYNPDIKTNRSSGKIEGKTSMIYFLEIKYKRLLAEVEHLKRLIREEEEKGTTKSDVKVVVETRGHGDRDIRRTTLVQLDLTSEQRVRLIKSLAWLRKEY